MNTGTVPTRGLEGRRPVPLLTVDEIGKHYGGLTVLDRCSLRVEQGSITGLIGPNGAGKTTLFEIISGFVPPDAGQITLGNLDITGLPPHRIARLGMVRTFQIPHEFAGMTVLDNLLVAPKDQCGERLWHAWFNRGAVKKQDAGLRRRGEEILDFLGLHRLVAEPAGNLSGGQKKLLELGRALMLEPQLLLLDEPVAGVNPTLMKEIAGRIRELRDQGMTLLVIEHKMEFIMELSDWMYVMAEGKVLTEGTPTEVGRNEKVLDAYLGVV
ncbi:MAG: ABC transporter ATP-binding protein [Chloroflexota bacterium]|nr:ABC transporter ATP-binding protein [Chloroflexota bacterium]